MCITGTHFSILVTSTMPAGCQDRHKTTLFRISNHSQGLPWKLWKLVFSLSLGFPDCWGLSELCGDSRDLGIVGYLGTHVGGVQLLNACHLSLPSPENLREYTRARVESSNYVAWSFWLLCLVWNSSRVVWKEDDIQKNSTKYRIKKLQAG